MGSVDHYIAGDAQLPTHDRENIGEVYANARAGVPHAVLPGVVFIIKVPGLAVAGAQVLLGFLLERRGQIVVVGQVGGDPVVEHQRLYAVGQGSVLVRDDLVGERGPFLSIIAALDAIIPVLIGDMFQAETVLRRHALGGNPILEQLVHVGGIVVDGVFVFGGSVGGSTLP